MSKGPEVLLLRLVEAVESIAASLGMLILGFLLVFGVVGYLLLTKG